MTSDKFIEQVKMQQKIKFPSGTVSAHKIIQRGLAEVIASLMPKEEVRDGLTLASLEYKGERWTGLPELLLLLEHYVLHCKGAFVEGATRKLTLTHDFFPLATLVEASVKSEHEGQANDVYLRSVKLTLTFAHGSVSAAVALPDDTNTVEGLLTFARNVLAAKSALPLRA